MNVLLTVSVIGAALFVWVCLFKVIPNALLSMFRYRLWRQRDDLAAAIRRGEFESEEQSKWVLHRIERFIRLAPQLSPMHIGLMRLSQVGMPEGPSGDQLRLDAVEPPERERLEKRLHALYETVADHALLETPSGWLTIVVGLPIALVVITFRRFRRDGYGGNLIDGARRRTAEGSAALASKGPFRRDLTSQHV